MYELTYMLLDNSRPTPRKKILYVTLVCIFVTTGIYSDDELSDSDIQSDVMLKKVKPNETKG